MARHVGTWHGRIRLSPRHGGEHGHLVAVGHRLGAGNRFAVQPHPAHLKLLGKGGSVAINGGCQHLLDGGTGHVVTADSGHLPDVGEQAQRGHDRSVRESPGPAMSG